MGTHVCIGDYKTRKDHPTWISQKWPEFHTALDHCTGEWDNYNIPEMYDNAEPDRRPKDIDLFEKEMLPHIENKEWLTEMCEILRSREQWAIYYSH